MVHQFLSFASEAKLLVAAGLACWVLAAIARVAEHRRHSRRDLDRVGWMPWVGLFLAALASGAMLILLGAKALL